MLNEIEHLLVCLGEEGGEVAKETSKALRFGLHDKNPNEPDGPDNVERLVQELNDLVAVADMLADKGVIPVFWCDPLRQKKKRSKVSSFLEYAREKGTLE